MPRERWFYARDMRRMGPVPKRQLLESLLALPDPRGCLIWRHGLPAWTPARDVPEIDRQLVPFVKAEPPPGREEALAAPAPAAGLAIAPSPPAPRAAYEPARARQPNIGLYFGGLGGLLALVVVGWFFWSSSKTEERPTTAAGAGRGRAGGSATGAVSGAGSNASAGEAPAGTAAGASGEAPAFAGWSDQEAELTPDQLRRLRGVGGWTGNTLTITLYNGSTWRITEIQVRTSHLRGDDFVDGETPHRLLPAGGAQVDAGMADLLTKVAPDRKKAGVNPLDTGNFEAALGPKPEAYRWRIEGARGYPPRG
jgi:hypothetical protein